MSVQTTELKVQRRLTAAFIDTQPVDLTLIPRTREKTSGGGREWKDGDPRDPQRMRLVEPPSPNYPTRTADGKERVVDFLLIGLHDASLGVYDVFEWDGGRWEVIFLYHFNGWERRAEVARHG